MATTIQTKQAKESLTRLGFTRSRVRVKRYRRTVKMENGGRRYFYEFGLARVYFNDEELPRTFLMHDQLLEAGCSLTFFKLDGEVRCCHGIFDHKRNSEIVNVGETNG